MLRPNKTAHARRALGDRRIASRADLEFSKFIIRDLYWVSRIAVASGSPLSRLLLISDTYMLTQKLSYQEDDLCVWIKIKQLPRKHCGRPCIACLSEDLHGIAQGIL